MAQKDNIQISLGIKGMERTTFNHLKDDKSYNYARNANLETDEETISLTNEHSNLLCSRFKPGYVVIKTKIDLLNNKIWFFLTEREVAENEVKRRSEIGFINITNPESIEDDMVQNCGCDIVSILSNPLENQDQIEYCNYTTLIQDCKESDYCLNFDINHPIKDVILKQEACGYTMTFTDGYNPPRYIILDTIDYYTTEGDKKCGDDSDVKDVCINCDKLRLFPIYNEPYIEAVSVNYGGNLKRGVYEFYIAYCDKLGNELSEYISTTNPVHIFDINNRQLNQTDRYANTTYGIRLTVKNLDKRFNFYKVIVVEKTDINENTSVFIEGIHSTTDPNILYTTNGVLNDQRSSLQHLYFKKPIYKKIGGFTTSNNYLFGYDYEVEKEWNLQPIVNLMGTFLKWQTVEATEDLYKDGVNISKYKSFMRDEVYPVSIRFITNNGYKTANFPFIGRPPLNSELIELDRYTNKDVESILENTPTCGDYDRKYKWQFYNTGKVLGQSYSNIIPNNYKIVSRDVEEDCIQENVKNYKNVELDINIENDFNTLIDYLNSEDVDVCDPNNDSYNQEICDILTPITNLEECDYEKIFPFPICSDKDDCENKYCDLNSPYYDIEKCKIITKNCESGNCYGICDDVVKIKDRYFYISSIKNEILEKIPKRYPWISGTEPTYEHYKNTKCSQWNSGMIRTPDLVITPSGTTEIPSATGYITLLGKDRMDIFDNHSCETSNIIPAKGQYFPTGYSALIINIAFTKGFPFLPVCSLHSLVYEKDPVSVNCDNNNSPLTLDYDNLFTDIKSNSYQGFDDRIHKLALWYEIDFSDNKEIFLEITPVIEKEVDDTTLVNDYVRITVFDSCKNLNVVQSDIYKSNEGYWMYLERKNFSNNRIFISLDTKIKHVTGSSTWGIVENPDSFVVNAGKASYQANVISTLPGCFDINIRSKEYYKVKAKYDELNVSALTTYTSNCKFTENKNKDCGVIPHKYGMFSYWESIEKYPDNEDLYDSSKIEFNASELIHEDLELINLYNNYYGNSENRKFLCKPIRHFKFPDNNIIPFMTNNTLMEFQKSNIYPIGITIDERTIKKFLDVAVNNNLITKEQRDSITGYEIFVGDRTINKSVIMKGIANDMYEDTRFVKPNQKRFFRNFPYNSLGKNQFITSDKEGNTLIDHPFSSLENNRFSIISPEVYYNRPGRGSEIVVDGYIYGASNGFFQDVKKHSEWVILGSEAYKRAVKLATSEIIFEIALNAATMTIESSHNYWITAGITGGGGNPIGAGVSGAAMAVFFALQNVQLYTFKRPKLIAEWMQIFEDRGVVGNFASMYVSDRGYYNFFTPNKEKGELLRGLVSFSYLSNGLDVIAESEYNKVKTTIINNKDRESSIYIYTGSEYTITYPQSYVRYDNTDLNIRNSSRTLISDNQCKKTDLNTKRIASPYISIKNYVPDQYGKIDEIKWLSTNHNPIFSEETYSKNIFGGDIYISRVDLKNKFKFFNSNAVTLANRTPFKYSAHSNVGYSKFYVDYKSSNNNITSYGIDTPYVDSTYRLDCRKNNKVFYESPENKFYLFSYGIPYFLIESEINSNFRYAGVEPHEDFASRGLNVEDWVQEVNVSIAHNNIFYYNSVYSRSQSGLTYRILPSVYSKEKWDCLSESENGVVWSDPDNSEVSLSDPWLVFRPFNIYKFPFNFGKLISLDPIESTQVIGRFHNNMAVFNAVDVLKDRITPDNEELGQGGIFVSRPIQFSYTELGETGSQHKSMVSCEFGHFWTDAKRGKIFKLNPNGQGLEVISDRIGGNESGMRKWFKANLPFKILKQGIENLTDEWIDNHYKGIGILMWWDSKFKRVFISKRDYIVKTKYKNKISFNNGRYFFFDKNDPESKPIEINLFDNKYFKDVSWTIAYSPIYGSWVSYYDFKPDYAIALNDYFYTGINYPKTNILNQDKENATRGLWAHLLTNKSYQVFYGKYYPFEIEINIKNNYVQNFLKDLKIWAYSQRYHNEVDYAIWRKKSFNKLIVHNQTNNSGLLHLNYDDSIRKSNFPNNISNIEQEIQATHHNNYISVNYMYNRVKNDYQHLPIWNWDENQIHKKLNEDTISFNSKRVLERLRGDWFNVLFVQDNTSQFKQVFKWMLSREEPQV